MVFLSVVWDILSIGLEKDMKKTALVTGGSSGIGLAIAEVLLANEYETTVTYRDDKQGAVARDTLGVNARRADLGNLEEVEALAETYRDSGLDVLVNCAGYACPQPVSELSLSEYERHFDVNIRAPLFLIRYLYAALKQKTGCVVNISSIMTQDQIRGFTLYTATKAALEGMTRSLALDLSEDGVRVNAICPGAIDTPMLGKIGIPPENFDSVIAQAIEKIPLGRLGTPHDIANVVMTQITSSYVTGAIWYVDGGVSL